MKIAFSRILDVIVYIAIVAILAIFGLLVYATFECPFSHPSENGKIQLCMQHMRSIRSVTNLFSTTLEAAENLKGWQDPWRHRYNVLIPDDSAVARFSEFSGDNIIIWSSGPNGINEYGQGDDIVSDGFCRKLVDSYRDKE